jgi:ABC-type multidrug transport system fused ATPase/permease subunit
MKITAENFTKYLHLLGKKSVFWLTLGILAGLVVSVVEVVLSLWIQIFLIYVGMSTQKISFLGYTLDWELTLQGVILSIVVIGSLRALCQYLIKQSALVSLEMINCRLRMVSLYEILCREDQAYVAAADTNLRISEIFPKAAMACYYLSLTIPEVIQVVVLTFLVFISGWQFAVIGIPGVALIGLVQKYLHKKVKVVSTKIPQEQHQLIDGIERIARNWLLVKVFRTQGQEYQKLLKNITSYSGFSIRAHFLANVASTLPNLLGILLLASILTLAFSFGEGLSGSKIVSFLYLFFRLVQILAIWAEHVGVVFTYGPQLRAAFKYFDSFTRDEIRQATKASAAISPLGLVKSPAEGGKLMPQRSAVLSAPPALEVTDLTVSYHNQLQPVLNKLSFSVGGGQIFAVVGRSGSGKSTLLGALLGVIRHYQGKILIAGRDIAEFYDTYHHCVGYVGTEPFLIAGSIADNLHYGSTRTYSRQEIEAALEKAALLSMVNASADGIHHIVKENGDGLSAGQKQRLGLARALIRNPRLLVLDEFTANLDKTTELEVISTLKTLKGKVTIILVSHRDTILNDCDVILDLDQIQQASLVEDLGATKNAASQGQNLTVLTPSFES